MQVGDLVIDLYDTIGVIIKQIGCVDRWLVHWSNGECFAYNGCNLEVLNG